MKCNGDNGLVGQAVPTEHAEQCALVAWARLSQHRYPALRLLVAVPNGGDRHPVVAAKLRAEGVVAGFPDLLLPVARDGCHGLLIELKRQRGGRLSPAQRAWHTALADEGYRVIVALGFAHARAAIEQYMRGAQP